MDELPKAECLAHVDSIIEDAIKAGTLTSGVVAQWKHSGEKIIVLGMFHSQGTWESKAVRWYTEGKRKLPGMFSKGLALYGRLSHDVAGLPIVR